MVAAAAQVRAVPGRVEFYRGEPSVVVDFAHTPDALEKVLSALAPHVEGRLICVVGCGGDRDPGKRPLMAQAAQRYADELWLTSDNPRSEDPAAIIEQMRVGLDEFAGGKTSIASFIADMATRLGTATGYLGTIGWGDLDNLAPSELTTASAITIQQRLAELVGRCWMAEHALSSLGARLSRSPQPMVPR